MSLLSIHPNACCGSIDIVADVLGWQLRCDRCGVRSHVMAGLDGRCLPDPAMRPARGRPARGWYLVTDCRCSDRSGLIAAWGPDDRRSSADVHALTVDIECTCSACGGPRTVWVVNQPCAPERPERLARWFMALSPWSQRS